jgi:serine protease AprX
MLGKEKGRVTKKSKSKKLQASDPEKKPFDPEVLDRTVIAIPLLRDLAKNPSKDYDVIIDLNLGYRGGRDKAQERVMELVREASAKLGKKRETSGVDEHKSRLTNQYLFATLEGTLIRELVRLDGRPNEKTGNASGTQRAIYRIWPDFPVSPLITKSISTVKADAARNAFAALGEDIVWAVMDSGIARHSHFQKEHNLDVADPLEHQDFTSAAEMPKLP